MPRILPPGGGGKAYQPSFGWFTRTGRAGDFSAAPHFLHCLRQLPFSVRHLGQATIPGSDMSIGLQIRQEHHQGVPDSLASRYSLSERRMRLLREDQNLTHAREESNLHLRFRRPLPLSVELRAPVRQREHPPAPGAYPSPGRLDLMAVRACLLIHPSSPEWKPREAAVRKRRRPLRQWNRRATIPRPDVSACSLNASRTTPVPGKAYIIVGGKGIGPLSAACRAVVLPLN